MAEVANVAVVPADNGAVSKGEEAGNSAAKGNGGNYTAASAASEIPANPTVIVKNLPYDLDAELFKEKLNEIADRGMRYKTYNLHTDPTGNFRGMVFINYRNCAQASKAFVELSALEFGGRKVRVEYRRLKAGEKPPVDEPEKPDRKAKRSSESNWRLQKKPPESSKKKLIDALRKEYEPILQAFLDQDKSLGTDMDLSPDLSAFDRKIVHDLAEEMGLGHKSVDTEEGIRWVTVTKDPAKTEQYAEESRVERVEQQKKKKERQKKYEEQIVDTAKFEAILRDFMEQPDEEGMQYEFVETLTIGECQAIHQIAESLELGHKVSETAEGIRCIAITKDPEKIESWREEYNKGNKRGGRDNRKLKVKATPEETAGLKWTVPRAHRKEGDGHVEENGPYNIYNLKLYKPPRQPKGPDGTRGFHQRSSDVLTPELEEDQLEMDATIEAENPPTIEAENPESESATIEAENPGSEGPSEVSPEGEKPNPDSSE